MVPRALKQSLARIAGVSFACGALAALAGCGGPQTPTGTAPPKEGAIFVLASQLDGPTRLERVKIAVDGYQLDDVATAGQPMALATPWLKPGAHTVRVSYQVSTECALGSSARRTYWLEDSRLVAIPEHAVVDVRLDPRGFFYAPGENFIVSYRARGDAPTATLAVTPTITKGPDACGPKLLSPEEVVLRQPRLPFEGVSGAEAWQSSPFRGTSPLAGRPPPTDSDE
jgi:hypothetical protein